MGEGDAEGEQQVNGVESPTSEGEDILIAPIQVIINQSVYSSEYESDEDEELEKKKKRTKKSKKKGGKTQPDKTMILTKTFAQAIRLINEQKVGHYNDLQYWPDLLSFYFLGERKTEAKTRTDQSLGIGTES